MNTYNLWIVEDIPRQEKFIVSDILDYIATDDFPAQIDRITFSKYEFTGDEYDVEPNLPPLESFSSQYDIDKSDDHLIHLFPKTSSRDNISSSLRITDFHYRTLLKITREESSSDISPEKFNDTLKLSIGKLGADFQKQAQVGVDLLLDISREYPPTVLCDLIWYDQKDKAHALSVDQYQGIKFLRKLNDDYNPLQHRKPNVIALSSYIDEPGQGASFSSLSRDMLVLKPTFHCHKKKITSQDSVRDTNIFPRRGLKLLFSVLVEDESTTKDRTDTDIELVKERLDIVGDSDGWNDVLDQACQVADTDITVVLEGETGVGKELISKVLHEFSSRRQENMVVVDCGAIPEGLIESELFGAEKGAYTGAVEERVGYFEKADGGTIFLDEIGKMPQEAQVRLLRVLDTGQFTRVGASTQEQVDVRIVAATNKNLAKEVKAGRFQKDLYYRLNSFIYIPPLRERPEDILPIFETYLHEFTQDYSSSPKRLTEDAKELLETYRWPGNVRQLRNIAEQVATLVREETVDADDLRPLLRDLSQEAPVQKFPERIDKYLTDVYNIIDDEIGDIEVPQERILSKIESDFEVPEYIIELWKRGNLNQNTLKTNKGRPNKKEDITSVIDKESICEEVIDALYKLSNIWKEYQEENNIKVSFEEISEVVSRSLLYKEVEEGKMDYEKVRDINTKTEATEKRSVRKFLKNDRLKEIVEKFPEKLEDKITDIIYGYE